MITFLISISIHVLELYSFELDTPVQYRAQLGLVLSVELQHVDLLVGVLLDVLQPHQGLKLVESSG